MKNFLKFLVLCTLAHRTLAGEVHVDGALAVDGNGTDPTYLAIRVQIPGGEALSHVRWVNNDEVSQPLVSVVAEGPMGTPSISGAAAVVTPGAWRSTQWVDGNIQTPVSSESGNVFVVFEFVASNRITQTGFGGGGGVAYSFRSATLETLISRDGSSWSRVSSDVSPMFSAMFVQDTGATILSVEGTSAKLAANAKSGQARESEQFQALLYPAAPNPFNPSTTLSFHLARSGPVELGIFNLRGQLVRRLRQGEYPAGEYQVSWEGLTDAGGRVASGIYLVRLSTVTQTMTQRIVLLK